MAKSHYRAGMLNIHWTAKDVQNWKAVNPNSSYAQEIPDIDGTATFNAEGAIIELSADPLVEANPLFKSFLEWLKEDSVGGETDDEVDNVDPEQQ